jgi:hypothetical protein
MSATKPLALSDAQYLAVCHAVSPLAPMEQSALLLALAHRLRGEAEIGDGMLFRVLRELQREIFRPPLIPRHSTAVHRPSVGPPIE